jgi:ribosomal protein S21
MLIVHVNNDKGGIEAALKKLKRKVRSVKQQQMLFKQKEFTKPSVKKRLQKQKSQYIQKLKEDSES